MLFLQFTNEFKIIFLQGSKFIMSLFIRRDWGFQGVIKRWGMKGMPKSHGTTKSERKMGGTGGGGVSFFLFFFLF